MVFVKYIIVVITIEYYAITKMDGLRQNCREDKDQWLPGVGRGRSKYVEHTEILGERKYSV